MCEYVCLYCKRLATQLCLKGKEHQESKGWIMDMKGITNLQIPQGALARHRASIIAFLPPLLHYFLHHHQWLLFFFAVVVFILSSSQCAASLPSFPTKLWSVFPALAIAHAIPPLHRLVFTLVTVSCIFGNI